MRGRQKEDNSVQPEHDSTTWTRTSKLPVSVTDVRRWVIHVRNGLPYAFLSMPYLSLPEPCQHDRHNYNWRWHWQGHGHQHDWRVANLYLNVWVSYPLL